MTSEQFAAALKHIGWSQQTAGRQFGRSTGTIRQWMDGHAPIPAEVMEWVTRTMRYLTRHPPPR